MLVIVIWKEKKVSLLVLGWSILFIAGCVRMMSSLHIPSPASIDYYNGSSHAVTGIVCDVPYVQNDKMVIRFCADTIEVDTNIFPVSGALRVSLPMYSQVNYGDALILEGKLETPKDFNNFSYSSFLAKDDIFSLLDNPSMRLITKDAGYPLYSFLYALRQYTDRQIALVFPGTDGALLSGLILGERKSLPPDLLANLQRTGLTHIVALSGFNITIIIAFLAGVILKRCRRSIRFVLSALFVILFTILVGATPSVVRASCMGLLGLFAFLVGRRSQALSLLLFALAFLTLLHPLSLVLDIGFQLSFLATLGLIVVSPLLQAWMHRVPSFFSLKEILITTLSAQIAVVPFLLLHFEQLSLISPLTNILVLSVIPVTMLIGSLAVFFSFIPFTFIFAKVIGFVAWLLLRYIMGVIDFFPHVPYSSLEISLWGPPATIIYYILLSLIVIYHYVRKTYTTNILPGDTP